MKPVPEKIARPLLLYISDTPELLSVLYDTDMLPEQHARDTKEYRNILLLAEAWKNREKL